jgi:hypothetical protein
MKIKLKYLLLSSVLFSSCKQTSDVSYEREAIKFEAERDAAKSQLVEKKSQIKELRSKLESMRAELAAMPEPEARVAEVAEVAEVVPAAIAVDANKVRLGLMNEVDKLQKTIEKQKVDIKVRNYTLGKVEIDTDFPFNATVIMNIYSTKKNTKSTLYWDARGNLNGEWVLSNVGNQSAEEDPPKVAANPTTDIKPTVNPAQPVNPVKPTPKPKPKPKPKPTIRARPGEHVIDWSKVK